VSYLYERALLLGHDEFSKTINEVEWGGGRVGKRTVSPGSSEGGVHSDGPFIRIKPPVPSHRT